MSLNNTINNNNNNDNFVNEIQNLNLQRQIELLEQKIVLNENEYNKHIKELNNQINILSTLENKLRNQLSTKDNALYELNKILKEYLNELINLKKVIYEKDKKITAMTNEFNSIKCNYTNISNVLNEREENHIKLSKDFGAINNQLIISEQKKMN